MNRDGNSPERRRFLQALGAGAFAAAGCSSSCAGKQPQQSAPATGQATSSVTTAATRTEAARVVAAGGKPRVVVVKARRALTQGYDADRGALGAMLEAGLLALAGEKDAARALASYVRAGERVGLKINGLAARQAATHFELVDELSALLGKADIEPRQQIVFDRFKRDLTESGFGANRRDGYRCVGNDEAGHEEEIALMPSSASRLARVLTRQVDGVINLPVLKQHMLSGMTGALKNNFGCIHNPNKMHLYKCDPYIAEVNAIPAIRDKQRLVIMDALRPVVEGGPSYQPGAAEVANLLLFATDLVAIDTVGLGILEDLRAKRRLPPLDKEGLFPTHLATAGKLGLGEADRARIDIVEIEV
ncbi:MAG: DUF362 domain-containing protein [Deltaproteobacteria bacterium]|nr:DUF362 domain-containing protein [Deltaproteobacteria bacterium]